MQNEIVFYCSKCRSSMRLSYRLTGTPEREVLPGAVLKCGKCKRTTVIEDVTEKKALLLSDKKGRVFR